MHFSLFCRISCKTTKGGEEEREQHQLQVSLILGGVHTCIHTCRSISVNIDKKREDKCQCIHVDVGESLTVLTKPKKACREDAIESNKTTGCITEACKVVQDRF